MKRTRISGQMIAVIITAAIIVSGLAYTTTLSNKSEKETQHLIEKTSTQSITSVDDLSVDESLVYSDGYKSIYFYSHAQLNDAFGHTPSSSDQELLKEQLTWDNLGLPGDFQELAMSAASYQKVPHLLTKIENNDTLYLKLVIIDKPSVRKAEYGIGNEEELIGFGHSKSGATSNYKSATHSSGIYDLDIQIDYQQNNFDIEFEYQIKRDGRIQVQYENEQTGVYTTGSDAEQLANKILDIDFKNTEEKDIIDHILEILEAPNSYKEFEIEVKYDDGTKIEFQRDK